MFCFVKNGATLLLALTASCWLLPAQAQNTSSVFGPVVDPGHRSAEYRLGYDPDSGSTAQRLHYQQSWDAKRRWRVIVAAREAGGSTFDFNYVQGELLWQLTADENPWQQGLRFDFRLRDADRPGRVGVNWIHQFQVSEFWRARLLLLSAVEFGDNASSGVSMQTRAQLSRSIGDGRRYGLEMFSSYGALDDIASLSDQRHQIGPFYTLPMAGGLKMHTSALFGVTDPTADINLGIWFSKSF